MGGPEVPYRCARSVERFLEAVRMLDFGLRYTGDGTDPVQLMVLSL